jgi:hypothetical protein
MEAMLRLVAYRALRRHLYLMALWRELSAKTQAVKWLNESKRISFYLVKVEILELMIRLQHLFSGSFPALLKTRRGSLKDI